MKKLLSALVLLVVMATAYAIKVDEVEFSDATKMATAASGGGDTGADTPDWWRMNIAGANNITCANYTPYPITTNSSGLYNPYGLGEHSTNDKIDFGRSPRFTTNRLYAVIAHVHSSGLQAGYRVDLYFTGANLDYPGYAGVTRMHDYSGEVGTSYMYMQNMWIVRGLNTNATIGVVLSPVCSQHTWDISYGYFSVCEL